jgi:Helix-turn-helix
MGKYSSLFRRHERRPDYWRTVALTEFFADLTRRMEERGITRKALADLLKTSRAYITKALGADTNPTVESLVRFAMAVDGVVHIHIADPHVATTWKDEPWGLAKTGDSYRVVRPGPSDAQDDAGHRGRGRGSRLDD